MEPQTHRLRPEGLSLNATFGGTVNNPGLALQFSQRLQARAQVGKILS